jgi:hypothetical protein
MLKQVVRIVTNVQHLVITSSQKEERERNTWIFLSFSVFLEKAVIHIASRPKFVENSCGYMARN